VVSSRQCSGSVSAGGSTSRTSINRSRTEGGRCRSHSPSGRRISTSPWRSSTSALRFGRPGSPAASSMVRRPAAAKSAAAANSVPSPSSRRSPLTRVSRWQFGVGTDAHLA